MTFKKLLLIFASIIIGGLIMGAVITKCQGDSAPRGSWHPLGG